MPRLLCGRVVGIVALHDVPAMLVVSYFTLSPLSTLVLALLLLLLLCTQLPWGIPLRVARSVWSCCTCVASATTRWAMRGRLWLTTRPA